MASPDYLTDAQASELLFVKPSTLAAWRCLGKKLPFFKINGRVRYLRSDVEAYAAKSTTRHDPSEVK